jgi:hypothetical protein
LNDTKTIYIQNIVSDTTLKLDYHNLKINIEMPTGKTFELSVYFDLSIPSFYLIWSWITVQLSVGSTLNSKVFPVGISILIFKLW